MISKTKFFLLAIGCTLGILTAVHHVEAAFGAYLSASPNVIQPGQSTTLHWTVAWGDTPTLPYSCTGINLSSFMVESGDSAASGDIPVSPDATTDYTLICSDSNGLVSQATTRVTVSALPVVTVSANPTSLPVGGGSTTISWSVGNATSCSQSGGTAAWMGLTGMHTGGGLPFSLATTATFSLTCSNAQGSSFGSVTVTVGDTGPGSGPNCTGTLPTNALAYPNDLTGLSTDTPFAYSATDTNAKCQFYCVSNSTWNGSICLANTVQGTAQLSITGTTGWSGGYPTIKTGEPITLNWTSSGFSFCNKISVDSQWSGSLSGSALSAGSETFVPANNFGQDNNVGIHAYYLCGTSMLPVAGALVLVIDPPEIQSFIATPDTIDVGASTTLKWLVKDSIATPSGGCYLYKNRLINGGSMIWSGDPAKVTEQVVSPTQSSYYFLTCGSGNNKVTSKVKVTVNGTADPGDGNLPPCNVGCSKACINDATSDFGTTCSIDTTHPVCCKPIGGSTQTCPVACKSACGLGEIPDNTKSCSTIGGYCCLPTTTSPPRNLPPGTTPPNNLPPGTTPPTGGVPRVMSSFISFQNPLKFTTIPDLLSNLLSSLQNIIVTLAIIFIIIGAFLYITSAGNEGRMETGKKAILAAIIGLAIGIAAPAFLKEIGSILGWTTPTSSVGTSLSLLQIAYNVLSFLLTLIGIIAIIMLVIGGMMYLTAAGNEDQIDRGKKIVKYSVIGIIIALASLVLAKQVAQFFV